MRTSNWHWIRGYLLVKNYRHFYKLKECFKAMWKGACVCVIVLCIAIAIWLINYSQQWSKPYQPLAHLACDCYLLKHCMIDSSAIIGPWLKEEGRGPHSGRSKYAIQWRIIKELCTPIHIIVVTHDHGTVIHSHKLLGLDDSEYFETTMYYINYNTQVVMWHQDQLYHKSSNNWVLTKSHWA